MREQTITLPELALIAGTRVVLGAGIGLLIASRLTEDQRRAAGWALVLVGAISTIPLAVDVLGKKCCAGADEADAGPGEQTCSSAA